MTTEEKDLLLKDLCARLPYGVIVETPKGKGHVCDINLTIFCNEVGVNINPTSRDKFNAETCKPYLFPLSSMTEEQKEELNRVTNGKFNSYGTYIDNCKPRNWNEWGITEYNWIRHHDADLLNTWLDKNYFDYRGLIPKGIANDATGLNVY